MSLVRAFLRASPRLPVSAFAGAPAGGLVYVGPGARAMVSNNVSLTLGALARADALAEFRNTSGIGHALVELFQMQNPGGVTEEAVLDYSAYTTNGIIRQMGSASMMWASADPAIGYSVYRIHATYGGGLSSDVDVRIFGNRGIVLFGTSDDGSETLGPKILRVFNGGIVVDLGLKVGTNVLATGGLFRSEGVSAMPDASGPGVELGYSSGAATAFLQGYNRTSSAFIPLLISAASVDFGVAPITIGALGGGGGLLSVAGVDSAGAGYRQVRVPN